ncbi:MAG: hypothetical protein GF405_07710 [Candidatus Eisenbacteria bacterium]|nr:hypothetical protein [Candidatus Eisenbacteria bacterium]
MTNRYCFLALVVVFAIAATPALATETLTVDSYKNCVGLLQAGCPSISLDPGVTYTVSVTGDAAANDSLGIQYYDGLFLYFFEKTDALHPRIVYLEKGETFDLTAGFDPVYAFLVDISLKDVGDNFGSMEVAFDSPRGRETLTVDAVFHCIGLLEYGGAKIVLTPGQEYTVSVTGDAATNSDPSGYYDGVCIFTRDISMPYHPQLSFLEFGEEYVFTAHATGWFWAFLVDFSFADMGNNSGSMTVEFLAETGIEEETWSAIKQLFQ